MRDVVFVHYHGVFGIVEERDLTGLMVLIQLVFE